MQDFLGRISHFSPKRLALLADELQRRVEALEHAAHAPIAIVGIGCRFPGGADTPARFWDLLCRGEDAITEVPADRWSIADYYDPDPDAPGRMSSRWGGFVAGVDRFDAHFFGISPREAQHMDPQQRLLLEVVWEALEHAGVNADRLAETRTGVFVGMSSVDYLQLLRGGGLRSFDAYTASGVAHSIASGRLSYLLGTRGPSMSIDTACSSSLVAIHQAVSSLRRGESDLALAGGVNLILRPDITVALSKAHMMAPDGRCKAFDARADGFVRSEGCGIVVLKRLADARADGDPVIAVIRGSAANQDGRSNGLTAPNGSAQEAVLRAALSDAHVEASEVQFVEAHGTGTSLGDPIEVLAIAAVFGGGRAPDRPLLIGSVKANIGHLEAAAGVAAVIKVALALEHGIVPPQLHFVEANPFIPWDEIPVQVPVVATHWPATADGARLAGASSFGFSGSNVHLVLSSAARPGVRDTGIERPRHLLTISARGHEARRVLALEYRRELSDGQVTLADMAHTANAGRAACSHRMAVIAASREEAIDRLDEIAAGATSATAMVGMVPPRPPRVAFLFTGQGSQYAGMARSLYDTQPRFREALDECDSLLGPRLAQPLLSVLYPPDGAVSPIDATEYSQPALFAVEYALAMLWQSWGVRPVAVLGHSLGEYVAACVAGVLTLDDALMLVAERGRLMGALPRNGAMAAVMTDQSRVSAMIAPWETEVAIAAVNGPEHVVISGREGAVDAILERAAAAGVSSTRLTVSHAFHSPLVEPMLAEFERIAATVGYRPAEIDVISNVTGDRLANGAANAAYWREHVRAPVQFARAVQALVRLGCDAFVEVGPHPTLVGMARHCLEGGERLWLPSLRRGADEWVQILESLARLYMRGTAVDWTGFDAGYGRRKVVLPRYPFQRQRFWVDMVEEPERGGEEQTLPRRVAQMMYEIAWRDGPIAGGALQEPGLEGILVAQAPIVGPATDAARWLIVCDAAGAGETLAAALRERGDEASLLAGGAGVLRAALDDAAGGGIRVAGVVHLAAVDVLLDEVTTADTLWADQERLIRGALDTVQTLAAALLSSPPILWFVTRGAQAVDGLEQGNPAQATLWGMSHVVALEHPELRCHRVDLDSSASLADSVPKLVAELDAWSREDQVALRGPRRLVRRLVRHRPVGPTRPLSIGADRTYLVTGGLGGIGLRVAGWLVDRGARSVVLMSRRPPGDAAGEALARLTARGASVVAMAGDVAREDDVRRVLDEIARTMPPLRGVVHAAGVLDDDVLSAQSWARFASVLAPKVLGTWHLHRLTGLLDFLVLFSSAAALAGSFGRANYAAANAFEDAIAWYRQSHGQPTVSINWGPWAEVGMAADRGLSGTSFVGQIPPGDGLLALEAALRVDSRGRRLSRAQLAVLASDWTQLTQSPEAWRLLTLYRELAPIGRMAAHSVPAEPERHVTTLRDRLRATAPNRRRAALQDHVRMLTLKVLGIEHADTIDVDEPLRQLGLDSLMAVELRQLLAKAVDRPMPATVTFDHPSVSALADYLAVEALADEMMPAAATTAPADVVAVAAPELGVDDDLSSDELAALSERLDRIIAERPL